MALCGVLFRHFGRACILSYRLECNTSRKDFEPLNQHNLVVFFEKSTKSWVSFNKSVPGCSSGEAVYEFCYRQQSIHLREKNIADPTERSRMRQAACASSEGRTCVFRWRWCLRRSWNSVTASPELYYHYKFSWVSVRVRLHKNPQLVYYIGCALDSLPS